MGFGRPCSTCGRSQYDHDKKKFGRNCDKLRLITQDSMYESLTGTYYYFGVQVPDSPYPRTKGDPRRWTHPNNIPRS